MLLGVKRAPFEIPKALVIRGKRWRIWRAPELGRGKARARRRKELGRDHGWMNSRYREILLAEHSSPREEASTLLHELLHACSNELVPIDIEEMFVGDVERALLRALSQLVWG